MAKHPRAFEEFVRARLPHLARLSRALTADDAAGGRLLQQSLAVALGRWRHTSTQSAEQEVRRDLVRLALRHKTPGGLVRAGLDSEQAAWFVLATRTPRERAAVALEFLEGLSEEEAAELLRCTADVVRTDREQALDGLDEVVVRRALEAPADVDQASVLAAVNDRVVRHSRRRNILIAGVGAAVCTAVALVGPGLTSEEVAAPGKGLADPITAYAASDESHVWAITRVVGCPNCSELWRGDGTASGWEKIHDFDQPPLVSQIRMAPDGENGWAWFGIDWLQATHDGGKTWVIPGGDLRNTLVDVQAAGDTVYALPGSGQLFSAPVGTDDWAELVSPGGVDPMRLVPFQDRMYIATGDLRTNLVASDTGSMSGIRPCPARAEPLRPTTDALFAVCLDDRQSYLWLLRSDDGVTWERLDLPEDAHTGMAPIDHDSVFVPAGDGANGAKIVTPQGMVAVRLGLRESERVKETSFVTEEIGFLLTTRGRLLRSDDAGRSWDEIG